MNFGRKRARPRNSFSSGPDFYALFYFFHDRIRELILNHLKNPETPPKKVVRILILSTTVPVRYPKMRGGDADDGYDSAGF